MKAIGTESLLVLVLDGKVPNKEPEKEKKEEPVKEEVKETKEAPAQDKKPSTIPRKSQIGAGLKR